MRHILVNRSGKATEIRLDEIVTGDIFEVIDGTIRKSTGSAAKDVKTGRYTIPCGTVQIDDDGAVIDAIVF